MVQVHAVPHMFWSIQSRNLYIFVLLSDPTFSLRQHGHWQMLHQAHRIRHAPLLKLELLHRLYDFCCLSMLMSPSRLCGL